MKKEYLLSQIKKYMFNNSNTYWAKLLCEFVKTDKIQELDNHKHIYFHDYLAFIQKTLLNDHKGVYPTKNPAELFEPPLYMPRHYYMHGDISYETEHFIKQFIYEDINNHKPIIPNFPNRGLVSKSIAAKVNPLLIYNSFLTCALFHKGMREVLPTELLLQIYSCAFPFQDEQTDIYCPLAVQVSNAFAQGICGIKFFDNKVKSLGHRTVDAAEAVGYAGLTLFFGTLTPTLGLLTVGVGFTLLGVLLMPIPANLAIITAKQTFFSGSKTKHKVMSALGYDHHDHSSNYSKSFEVEIKDRYDFFV